MELETALTESGFRVLGPAASVEDALCLLEDEQPDVAVLDFNLGREIVIPVALLLKALGIPFLMASASDATEFARYAVLNGVTNVGKPTEIKSLIIELRARLE